jgi:mannose-6-phosphate isomerase-like protein (cupin superfamily)
MNQQPTGKIDKGWGFELVWANNEKYCGKILVFEKVGAKTSLVFHREKRKSWFVNEGRIRVTWTDVGTGELKQAELEAGKTADFAEMSPHQVEALEPNTVIFEVGTTDIIEDRFRLQPGDTQTKKPEQQ